MRSVLETILDVGVLPVVRLDDLESAAEIAQALAEGGVPVVEYTLTNPLAIDAVRTVRTQLPDVLTGAGTVLDAESARLAILAGAQFLVTPAVRPDVIVMAQRYGIPTFCGALTATEILNAWELGSPCIKVFPAGVVGPSYFKAIREPLSQIRLMPSGGVTVANAGDFIRAGAVAVSAGGQLVDRASVTGGDWGAITARAAEFVREVRAARDDVS